MMLAPATTTTTSDGFREGIDDASGGNESQNS